MTTQDAFNWALVAFIVGATFGAVFLARRTIVYHDDSGGDWWKKSTPRRPNPDTPQSVFPDGSVHWRN